MYWIEIKTPSGPYYFLMTFDESDALFEYFMLKEAGFDVAKIYNCRMFA